MFKNKTVLITGGTGSFGRWILKDILKNSVKELRILSRDEEKQLDVKREAGDPRIRFFIGDVRDYDRVVQACTGVDILYHAAAQKIIDSCEDNPTEALKTNVIGTWNAKKASVFCGVERSLLISTDKAVKPVNLYGMTKGMAEKIWIRNEDTKSNTKFSVVRYGNVIGSRGSVVPYFKQLVNDKKPLPITHRDMTRFLITLKQATELVFHATRCGNGGEIFVPDLPACKIVDLAKAMAGDKYPLKFVGIRPGEKIHECLIQEYEIHRTEKKEKYFIIHSDAQLNHSDLQEEYTSDKTKLLDKRGIITLLREAGWA
jgi:UDP-N-acetylglucosamine 4,6-dehydratase/5-epimerase